MKLATLKKRKDFILSNKHGKKFHSINFIIQEYYKSDDITHRNFFGFTATKRIGNAVKRNRAKRIMRSLIIALLKEDKMLFKEKYSYVLIAKQTILKTPFFELYNQFKECLSKSWLKVF